MHLNIRDGVISNLNIRSGAGSKGKYAIANFQIEGVDDGDFDFLGLPEDKFDEPEDVISNGDRLSVVYQGVLKRRTIIMANYNYRTKTLHDTKWKIGFVLLAGFLLMWACFIPEGFTLIQGGENPIKAIGIVSCIPLILIIFVCFLTHQSYAASKALKLHCQNTCDDPSGALF